jgi:beta-lactamase regulating signal transducer with metallopeptidase domain
MTMVTADPTLLVALAVVVKATALLGIAAIMQLVVFRRASAATRHLVWTIALVSVLLLPVVSLVGPAWTVEIPAATKPVSVVPVATSEDAPLEIATAPASPVIASESTPALPRAANVSWSLALIIVYCAGAIGLLIYLLAQQWSVRRFARQATLVEDRAWTRLLGECAEAVGICRPVRLLRSRTHGVPLAFGTRRPSIVIPDIADQWTQDRRRAVLLHELAHVARRDCLTQSVAFGACALYWFHPALWWVAGRLRVERELACDDRVIAAGAPARDYAGHLLEIAYSLGGHGAPALAVTMARPRQLEGRMLAALDDRRDRTRPAIRFGAAIAVAAVAILLPLAAAAPTLVAASGGEEAVAVPARTAATPIQVARLAPHLKEVSWPVSESVRRLVREMAAAIGIAQDNLPGTWEVRRTNTDGVVRLRLVEINSSSDSNVPLERLEGLTAAQLTGSGGPVQFRMRRDAGTFTFEGVLRNGVGAGTFSFAADPNFPEELAKRGFARPTAAEQYQMARHDIGYAFVDELSKQGYTKPQTSELVRAGQHGVQVTYLREMGALGYRLGSLAPLIELRDHGVTPSYVRELADLGYKGLPADEIRRARDHGITPEYVTAMRDAGYGSLPMDALIKARDHGVTPEFVRGLHDAGHAKLPLDELIRVRDHGVTPEYARDMRQLGHALPVAELVRARDHGITTEFVRELAALGYSNLPMDALIRLRDHGVTPEYVRELKALGYDRLTQDDLVTLRDHGLTPERIKTANARAGTRLPVDLLKSFAAGGMR